MYSVSAGNSRDAQVGEDLVVTQALHGQSNWLTQEGTPNIAVCVPHTASLAVQLPNQIVRGARFEQSETPDAEGNRDFLVFLDGEMERVPLNYLPKMTKVRVLRLRSTAQIPEATLSQPTPPIEGRDEGELVAVGVSGGEARSSRRRSFIRIF